MHFSRRFPPITLVVLLAATPAFAQNGAKSPGQSTETVAAVRKQIEQIVHQTDAAAARKDVKGSLFHFAEGYQTTGEDGKVRDRKMSEANTKKLFSFVRSPKAYTDIKDVSLANGQAIVLSNSRDEYDILETKSGKPHHFVNTGSWKSVWIREKGNWRVWRSQKLSGNVTMDGKPFRRPPAKAPAPKAPK